MKLNSNIEKEVIRISTHTTYKDISIELNAKNLELVKNQFMNIIEDIVKKYEIKISLCENSEINYEKINIIYNS